MLVCQQLDSLLHWVHHWELQTVRVLDCLVLLVELWLMVADNRFDLAVRLDIVHRLMDIQCYGLMGHCEKANVMMSLVNVIDQSLKVINGCQTHIFQ